MSTSILLVLALILPPQAIAQPSLSARKIGLVSGHRFSDAPTYALSTAPLRDGPTEWTFSATSSAADHATAGISLAKQGKLPDAEQELDEAVREAPDVALYRAQLGSILGLEGKWKEALESLKKAVELDPQNLSFRRETAAVQWQLGFMPAAEENLNYVLSKQPNDSGATLLLGLVKERTGDYATAAKLLDSQFDLAIAQPERAVALFHSVERAGQNDKIPKIMSALHSHSHDAQWVSALERCTQIAVVAQDLEAAQSLLILIPDTFRNRTAAAVEVARLLYNRGDTTHAKELLLKLPDQARADVQTLLGNCLATEHQPALAMQAYRKAINLEPTRLESYEEPISMLLEDGNTRDALALVNQAFAIAPNDFRVWLWKGNLALRAHSYNEAIESYRQAGKLDSENPQSVLGVAAVYFVSGQNEAAIAEYKNGIARFPDEPRLYLAYASILQGSPDFPDRHAEAKSLLRKAVALDPNSAEAHYQLGQLALLENQLKEAEQELSLSVRLDGNRSKVHYALSVLYRRIGRADDAARQFTMYEDLKQSEERGIAPAIGATLQP